jgi:hypothetical protein
MSKETHNIELIFGNERIMATIIQEFIYSEIPHHNDCQLTLKCRNKEMVVIGDDFFNVFNQIRQRLEPQGILFNVYGASLGVWTSGMSASMSAGTVAYNFNNIENPTVGIFETGDDVFPTTLNEQEKYFLEKIYPKFHKI